MHDVETAAAMAADYDARRDERQAMADEAKGDTVPPRARVPGDAPAPVPTPENGLPF
jgi:hypothetical protein